MTSPAVGIDLGTTYSCVAVFLEDKVEVIPNAEGNRITPSYVAFTDAERLVGDAAKDQGAVNETNTIFNVKRLIGRKFDDPLLQADMKHWPFQVVSDDSGKPKIKVQHKGKSMTFFPEEVSSMVLSKMKDTAEAYLGQIVKNAVITVPAYFNDSQRQATKAAGTIAGLNVLRVLNEPTAGALAYGFGKKIEEEINILVFDLGGGTFDVSIVIIEESIFEVRATAGDTHLGGEDFDNRMVEYFVQEFGRKFKMDLRTNKKALRRLRMACERAKRTLSTTTQVNIELPVLHNSIDFTTLITRSRFEQLNKDLFKSTIDLIEKALQTAEMNKADINEIVLVGGSSQIPMVQKLLQDFFGGRELNKSVNPDEAVAYGAAVQASILLDNVSPKVRDLVLVDVTPLSLGINMQGGIMKTIIERNTIIPTKQTKRFTTCHDNQYAIAIEVLEGERSMSRDNNILGKFGLIGIPPAPRKVPNILVTFEIDANGILHVTASETSTNTKNQITINKDEGRLSKEQIEKLVKDAEQFKLDDQRRKEAAVAKNELEDFCITFKRMMEKPSLTSKSNRKKLGKKCQQTLCWICSNPKLNKNDYDNKMKELKQYCNKKLQK